MQDCNCLSVVYGPIYTIFRFACAACKNGALRYASKPRVPVAANHAICDLYVRCVFRDDTFAVHQVSDDIAATRVHYTSCAAKNKVMFLIFLQQ